MAGDDELSGMAEVVRRKPIPTATTTPMQQHPERPVTPPTHVREPLLEDQEARTPVQEVPTAHDSIPWHRQAGGARRESIPERDAVSDIDSRVEPAPRQPRKSKTRKALTWMTEFVWCLISIAILGALAVILAMHDDRPIPSWPLGLTLNTIVALLATFCRAAFVVAVTEGVSQMKWNWFAEKPRPLNDLEVFDLASRGPWGSIYSLFACRWSVANTLSAVVLVTGLATSTLTQSAVTYESRPVPNGALSAESFSRHHYPTATNTEGHDRQNMTDNTNRAIFQAVFGPVGQAWPLLEPVCPSGECTWPLFSSLAVCVSMENVTDQLVFSYGRNQQGDTNYTASLLDGTASLSAPESMPLMQMVSPEPPTEEYVFPLYRESVAFNNRPDLLNTTFSQFFFIYNNNKIDSRRQSFRAVELLWHFCVNTYNVTVSGGQAQTNIVESRTQVDDVFDAPHPMMRLKAPEGYEGDEEFIIDSWWEYTRLDLDMRRAFSGNWGPNVGTDWPYSEANRQFGLKIYPQGANMTAEDADRRMWNGIGDIAQAMGDSMTNLLRTTGEAVQGTVLVPQTFVRVRWEWLAFLSAQVGLSIVFVSMVVVQTARLDLEIVKSSALAGVFAVSGRGKMALEEDGRDSWGFSVGSASGSAKSKPVSRATARLQRDGEGDGWTLAVWPGEEEGERKRRVRQSVQRIAVSNHQGFT